MSGPTKFILARAYQSVKFQNWYSTDSQLGCDSDKEIAGIKLNTALK